MKLKLLILVILTSCNYTISVNHTDGMAGNVGDESPTATADVDATANLTKN